LRAGLQAGVVLFSRSTRCLHRRNGDRAEPLSMSIRRRRSREEDDKEHE